MKLSVRNKILCVMYLALLIMIPRCGSTPQRDAQQQTVKKEIVSEQRRTEVREVERKAASRRYRAGDTKTVGGIELVYIPGGSFMMGSPDGEGDSDEHPRHRVTVSGFWMGKYEVTQKQYLAVIGNNPSYFSNTGGGRDRVQGDTSQYPVEAVNWYDTVEYCNKLSRRAGLRPAYVIEKSRRYPNKKNRYDRLTVRMVSGANGFRLPYEAEWEYACRAGTAKRYYWGDSIDGNYCWYRGNTGRTTHTVGEKRPNAFGLYDLSGNVMEWCMDWYDSRYYRNSPRVNPKGPASGRFRVLRGGSRGEYGYLNRSAVRNYVIPVGRFYNRGFRVVVSAVAE